MQTIEKSPTKTVAPDISKTKDIAIPIADCANQSVKPKGDIDIKCLTQKL